MVVEIEHSFCISRCVALWYTYTEEYYGKARKHKRYPEVEASSYDWPHTHKAIIWWTKSTFLG